jgi:hypothetical protein
MRHSWIKEPVEQVRVSAKGNVTGTSVLMKVQRQTCVRCGLVICKSLGSEGPWYTWLFTDGKWHASKLHKCESITKTT